jgi:hypothetical protein
MFKGYNPNTKKTHRESIAIFFFSTLSSPKAVKRRKEGKTTRRCFITYTGHMIDIKSDMMIGTPNQKCKRCSL